MEPPKGFTFDAQSGKYYHRIEAVDQATGAKAQLVSWFDPQTGQVTRNAYPTTTQPAAVMGAAQRSRRSKRSRKSPVRAIICVLVFFGTIAFGAWRMGWLTPLFHQLGVPTDSISTSSTSTGRKSGGTATAAGVPNAYQEWKAANLVTSPPDLTGVLTNVVRTFYGSTDDRFVADPEFPNGKWLSEDGKSCIYRKKYISFGKNETDIVYFYLAYEPGDYGSGDSYGTLSGPLLRNDDGSFSIGDQEIYPDLKITVEEDLSLTVSGSPINTESYHSDDFVAYNAESPYQSYQMVFNRDTAPPPPEDYKTMLNTTIPLPKERGEEVSVDGMPSYYVEPEMDAHISFVNYYSTAVLQVQRQKGNVELKDAVEMARNATPQSMSGTPYFDGKYLYIDVTEVSDSTDDFKNSDLKEIIFGMDDEGNLVLLRDDIGELKAGTVFWR